MNNNDTKDNNTQDAAASNGMSLIKKRRANPSMEDLLDPSKQAGYLSLFHAHPLTENERLPLPILPEIFRMVPYPHYNVAKGIMQDTAEMHLMLRIVGDPGVGKTRLLIDFKKECDEEYEKESDIQAHYVGVPKHSDDKDLLLLISTAIGYYPDDKTSSLQVELITHINNQARPIVILIDEVDNVCPRTTPKGTTNLDKLDVVRFVWDHTRQYASFIFAAPYDLESKIQRGDEPNFSNSQISRRCPVHPMTGMPDNEAREFLSFIEEDFNVKFSDSVGSKLLQRIHNVKRGGLGVVIDILFRAMRIEVPHMKEYYLALLDNVPRNEALKLINHKETIQLSEDIILGSMSIQR